MVNWSPYQGELTRKHPLRPARGAADFLSLLLSRPPILVARFHFLPKLLARDAFALLQLSMCFFKNRPQRPRPATGELLRIGLVLHGQQKGNGFAFFRD